MIEKINYLLFLKRLDDLHALEESRAATLEKPIFPEGKFKPEGSIRRVIAYEAMRWSRLKNWEPGEAWKCLTSTSSLGWRRGLVNRQLHEDRAYTCSGRPARRSLL